MPRILISFQLTSCLIAWFLAVAQADGQGKVKVFLLAGQSNMEGKAKVSLLDYQASQPGASELFTSLRATDRSWRESGMTSSLSFSIARAS